MQVSLISCWSNYSIFKKNKNIKDREGIVDDVTINGWTLYNKRRNGPTPSTLSVWLKWLLQREVGVYDREDNTTNSNE